MKERNTCGSIGSMMRINLIIYLGAESNIFIHDTNQGWLGLRDEIVNSLSTVSGLLFSFVNYFVLSVRKLTSCSKKQGQATKGI